MIVRLVLGIVGAIAAVLLAVAFTIVWSLTTSLLNDSFGIPTTAAVLLALLAPALLFVFSSAARPRIDGRKAGRAVLGYAVFAVVEAAALTMVIIEGVHTQPWLWVPTTIVVIGVVGSVLAILLGRRLRSTEDSPGAESDDKPLVAWTAPPPARRVLVILIPVVFVVVTGVMGALFVSSGLPFHGSRETREIVELVLTCLSAGFIAAFFVSCISWIPRSLRVQATLPPGSGRRKIASAVWRNTPEILMPLQLEYARRYATVAKAYYTWMLVSFGLIYLGIECTQIATVLGGSSVFGSYGPYIFGVLYLLVIVADVAFILRCQRFLRANGAPTPMPDLAAVPA